MDNQRGENLGNYAEDYQDAEVFEEMEDDLDDDENIEAFGEDDLDDDESFYAEYDDDDESMETFGEDDLDDDESFYAEYDDDDEGFEYDDDDESYDEGFEELGEADDELAAEISRSARRRRWRRMQIAKMRAKQRAKRMQMKAKAARLRAARNARKARRKLANKLKVIRTRRTPVVFTKITKPLGTGYIRATLRNGRSADMKITPAIAMRTDVRRLAQQVKTNGVKWNKAIRVQGKNIKLLKSAQSSAVKSLTAQQLKSSKLLTKQIADGDKNLDKRITKLVNTQKKTGRRQDRKMLSKVQQQQKRSTWNTALVASSIPLFAAYGDRAVGENANPITKKNLFIAGSTAFFLFADDLLVRYMAGSNKKWRTGLNLWNVAAPFLNWGAVYYFMKDHQHQRFVTGIDTIEGDTEVTVTTVPVGKDHGFDKFSDVPVFVTLNSIQGGDVTGVTARVEKGELMIKLVGCGNDGSALKAEVAWAVDTKKSD